MPRRSRPADQPASPAARLGARARPRDASGAAEPVAIRLAPAVRERPVSDRRFAPDGGQRAGQLAHAPAAGRSAHSRARVASIPPGSINAEMSASPIGVVCG